MTAYRYVRLGLLDAGKVSGTWQVSAEAVERFRAGEESGPVEHGHAAPWADRLEARLIAADSAGAWGVIEAALASGADLEKVYVEVISPAMVSIGGRWASGELDIAVEHAASGIVTRLIGRLGHRFARRGRSRGTVVLGAPAGEAHALPSAMLGDLLRLQGWDILDLGANTPAASFVYTAEATHAVAVGVSVTSPEHLGSAAEVCTAMRSFDPSIKILVGGQAIGDASQAEAIGADGWGTSAGGIGELLAAWTQPEKKSAPVR